MLVLPVAGQSGGRCDPYLFLCSGVYRPAGGGRQVMEVTKRTRPEGFRIKPCRPRSEEHTSELQSLMRISYAVFCLKKKIINYNINHAITHHTHLTLTSAH